MQELYCRYRPTLGSSRYRPAEDTQSVPSDCCSVVLFVGFVSLSDLCLVGLFYLGGQLSVRMWSVGFWFICRVSCSLFAGGFVAPVMSLAVECWWFRLLVRLLCCPSRGFVDLGFSSFLSGQSCASWPTGFLFGCCLRCSRCLRVGAFLR